jgi:hypothetical protein
MTPIETGMLDPGQRQSYSIQLDGSSGVVLAGVVGGRVAATRAG